MPAEAKRVARRLDSSTRSASFRARRQHLNEDAILSRIDFFLLNSYSVPCTPVGPPLRRGVSPFVGTHHGSNQHVVDRIRRRRSGLEMIGSEHPVSHERTFL